MEEMIVRVAEIGGLIVMNGLGDPQKLLQSNVSGIRRLIVGRRRQTWISLIRAYNVSSHVLTVSERVIAKQ
jgi:hypothetical protein